MQTLPSRERHDVQPPTPRLSFRRLYRRCRQFGVTQEEVRGCRVMADLQALVKPRYRVLARACHPDMEASRDKQAKERNENYRHPLTGWTFRRLTKTYAWLMAQPPTETIDQTCWAPLAMYEMLACLEEAPWYIEWARDPVPVGDGWQITYCP